MEYGQYVVDLEEGVNGVEGKNESEQAGEALYPNKVAPVLFEKFQENEKISEHSQSSLTQGLTSNRSMYFNSSDTSAKNRVTRIVNEVFTPSLAQHSNRK
jgi:hypothetical protein